MRLFVFGLGYSARAVVQRMRPRLEAAWGTTRSAERFDAIRALGVEPVSFDAGAQVPPPPLRGRAGEGGRPQTPRSGSSPTPTPSPQGGGEDARRWEGAGGGVSLASAIANADHALVSIAPDEAGDPVLTTLHTELTAAKPKSIVYLSTVGVYGDHGGGWVDEASECRPGSDRSRRRLAAETAWRRFGETTGAPVAIIRLAGIYGPRRGPFEKIRRGTAQRIVKPGQVFNRIHVDDIAAIVEAVFLRRADGVFNGADDEPAPPQDVLGYAAELLRAPPPPEVAYDCAELSPMARSFYGENKRVRNLRIKDELRVRLAYPTYREGLRAVLAAEEHARRAAPA